MYIDKQDQRNYAKAHYLANRDKYSASARKSKKKVRGERRELVIKYLQDHPCMDCGETDLVVLQFDHVRGKKIAEIGTMLANGVPLNLLLEEIDKCDVVCANDHFRRTASRDGRWYKMLAPVAEQVYATASNTVVS